MDLRTRISRTKILNAFLDSELPIFFNGIMETFMIVLWDIFCFADRIMMNVLVNIWID